MRQPWQQYSDQTARAVLVNDNECTMATAHNYTSCRFKEADGQTVQISDVLNPIDVGSGGGGIL